MIEPPNDEVNLDLGAVHDDGARTGVSLSWSSADSELLIFTHKTVDLVTGETDSMLVALDRQQVAVLAGWLYGLVCLGDAGTGTHH